MATSPDTRFSLLEKIRDSANAEAWTEFVAIYQPLIMDVCRRKGLQHADAVDVAQEVLSRVASGIEGFRHDHSGATFRGWLYRITRNLTVDFVRQRCRDPLARAASASELHQLPEPSAAESREFEAGFRRQMFLVVARLVESQVQPNTWAAFWRIEFEQQDVAAVAAELGMTRGAVYVAKCRVIARLRQEVQQRLGDSALHSYSVDSEGD